MIPALATLCFAVGGWWIFRSLRTLVRGVLSRDWPATDGEIRSVKVVKKFNSKGREVWREDLEYKYSVNGTRHRGTRRRFGVPSRYDWNHLSEQPMRRGDHVEVIYSEANPTVSALRRGFSPFAIIPLIAGAGMIWAGVNLVLT